MSKKIIFAALLLISSNVNAYGFYSLTNDVNALHDKVDSSVATSTAIGGLAFDSTAGKMSMAIGAASNQGYTSLAVGFANSSENGHMRVKLSLGGSITEGRPIVSTSVGWTF